MLWAADLLVDMLLLAMDLLVLAVRQPPHFAFALNLAAWYLGETLLRRRREA